MYSTRIALTAVVLLFSISTSRSQPASYDDLASFFEDWRAFQKAPLVDGVPDYSADAMSNQHAGLDRYRDRLASIDTTGWPVSSRVDYHLVYAEMNGMDFDHRVLRPWARDPGFWVMLYWNRSDVPEREAPQVDGTIELWTYDFPLSDSAAAEIRDGLERIPPLYERARSILTGNSRDLWVAGVGSIESQLGSLDRLAEEVRGAHDDLLPAVNAAGDATERLRDWLSTQAPSKTGPSGIGIENYEWYLKNVHLVPHSWEEQMAIIQRELYRALASLQLDEQRNQGLPALAPVASSDEYEQAFKKAVGDYMLFLEQNEIVTTKDYYEPALLEQMGSFVPSDRERGFFTIVDYHDPIVMRTHHYHWIELARMANEPNPSPIRRVPLLYNIFDGRSEGLATWMEEAMMRAGLLDTRPRSRELIWTLLIQRGARALAEMHMHSNQMSMQEAAAFASRLVPRGWLPADGSTIQHELHFYLQQPVYGTTYVVGKADLDALLAKRSIQEGEGYTIRTFLDELNGTGVIPISLIEWDWGAR